MAPSSELPYAPHAPRSSSTIAWTLGRGVVWLVHAFVVFAITIASIAFVLQLLGANPSSDFVNWIYRSTARLMQPFRGIFPNQTFSDQSILNVSLLFAIIMYGLFAVLMHEGVTYLDRKRAQSAGRDRYRQEEHELDLRDQQMATPAPTAATAARTATAAKTRPANAKQKTASGAKPR